MGEIQTMFSNCEIEKRSKRAEAELARLKEKGIQFAQLEVPDNNGIVRGKICNLKKALSPTGSAMSTLTVATRSGDQLSMTPFSNQETGFTKMVALPDYDTVVEWPWRNDMAAVLCDFYLEDGTPCPHDGRQILKKILAEYEQLGLEPKVALEFETYIYEACEETFRTKQYLDLVPWGNNWDFYSLTRYPAHKFEEFAKAFLSRMQAVGITVEAFHTEYGDGMYEFTVEPASALKAADDAIRSKLYLKQLCHEFGLVPSFMAAIRPDANDSMTGCHHNLSIWENGKNAFWDKETKSLTTLGRHFSGGVLNSMIDFHLLFRPWVNSYHRMDPVKWCPANASWGLDNHSVALRVIHGSKPEKYTRLEHRVPATDINPYLSIAAILAGGLYGLRNKIEPGDYTKGNAIDDKSVPLLSRSMLESIKMFRKSPITRELLGNEVVEHIAIVKQDEWDEFIKWSEVNGHDPYSNKASQWELEHYFLWL
jgi:glutamine synthetase